MTPTTFFGEAGRASVGAPRRRARRAARAAAALCATMLAGCMDDAVAPHVPAPPTDATSLYWALRNDHRAVTLSTTAPYDTLRITAVPLDALGRPLSLEGTLTYTSSDPARLRVDADGLLRAVAPGTNLYVVSALAAGNVRHVDTTIVSVTSVASPPTVARFSVQPVPPDSTRWSIFNPLMFFTPGYDKRLAARVEDAGGRRVTGVAVRYTSSDPVQVLIRSFTGEINAMRRGSATFTAEATIYGTKWTDSVEFEFDWPVLGTVQISNSAAPGAEPSLYVEGMALRISEGGAVAFMNATGVAVGIEFDDPTNVEERTVLGCVFFPDVGGRGNIAPFGGGPVNAFLNCRSRRFPVPGIYPFRVTPSGPTGRIIVERRDP